MGDVLVTGMDRLPRELFGRKGGLIGKGGAGGILQERNGLDRAIDCWSSCLQTKVWSVCDELYASIMNV